MLAALGFVSVAVEYSPKQHSVALRNSMTGSAPLLERGVVDWSKACDGRSSASAIIKARPIRRGQFARILFAAVHPCARGRR